MSVRQPMVLDPRNIETYMTMDTILEELASDKGKVVQRATANYESCRDRLRYFALDHTVCRRFIDITFDHFPSYVGDVVSRILDHVGSKDTSVLLYLVNRLIDMGNMTLASSIYADLVMGQDLTLRELVLGKFAYVIGNHDEAKQHFIRVVLTDPGFYEVYRYLDESDPGYGWLHIANCHRVMNGEQAVISEGLVGGDREEVFCVCDQWSGGDWKGAIAALRRTHLYGMGDPFTLAIFADMSYGLGSLRDAKDAYASALTVLKDSEYLSINLAKVYSSMGDYDSAITLLRRVKTFNPHRFDVLVAEYCALIDDGRRQDASSVLESLMASADSDAEVIEGCIRTLRSHGMTIEARNLSKRVSIRCMDKAYGEYLLATDSMANRDYRTAISHTNASLRLDKGCIRARCLRAKAYLEIDGVTKAMQDVNRMLDDSPEDLMVLDVKKDIHIAIGHYDDALELCDHMLTLDPRNADVMKDRAKVLGLMGDHSGSLDSYREALNIREDVKLFVTILKELMKQRRVSDICRIVDDFDDTFGRSVMVWRLRGNAEYASGRYEDAIASYGRAVALSPNEGEIWHSKGLAEEAIGSYVDAEDSFGRALLVDLDNTDYWISKAIVQEKRGNIRGAIVSLNRVITSADNGVFPLATKARLLARCGRVRESLYFLDQAQRIEPNNVDVMRMSKDAYMHLREYRKAMECCKRINSITGGDHGATMDLIIAYLEGDERQSATELLERLVLDSNLSFPILSKCAQCFHRIGDFDSEVSVLERALALSPDDRDVMSRLAEAYAISGERDLATRMYDRLVAKDPKDISTTVKRVMLDVESEVIVEEGPSDDLVMDTNGMMDLARKSLESGMVDEALQILHKVIDDDPDCADAHVTALEVLLERGDVVDVIVMASESTHLFPNDTRIMKLMGDAYSSAGDFDSSVESYTNAMRCGMDTAEVHNSIGLALESIGMMRMALDNLRIASEKEPTNLQYRLDLASLESKVGHDDVAETILDSILAVDRYNIHALRMYVSICNRRNDSEAILALFDDMMSVAVGEDDIRFFENILRDIGEHTKADLIVARIDR